MNYLNLGCGNSFYNDWINIDFVSNSPYVIAHDLRQSIPCDDNTIDVVYHSHILEHFSKVDGHKFILECFRVLKKGGIIRIAVPNLEVIVQEYLKNLRGAIDGNEEAKINYDWIVLELFDQMVREKSGGEMAGFIFQEDLPNEDYIYSRIGYEGRNLRNQYLKMKSEGKNDSEQLINGKLSIKRILKQKIKSLFVSWFLKNELNEINKNREYIKVGKFRNSGEIHKWMYDRYSLSELLIHSGFKNVQIQSASSSNIPDWGSYGLDIMPDGLIRKPDSLFIEAIK